MAPQVPERKRRQTARGATQAADDRVFKALASADRRCMLDALRGGPQSTSDLCGVLPRLNRVTVMQHLKVLEDAGLVVSRKVGRTRWNYLDVQPLQAVYSRWISDYAQPSAEFLLQLKTQLEGAPAEGSGESG